MTVCEILGAMLASSVARIDELLSDADRVLDVGGWAKPLTRADWVIDLLPYETRGLYGYDRAASSDREHFDRETWVQRDICDHEPWPFADASFDFAVCAHTLEDVRDPVWVCRELQRVARAGYIEVPSRLEEQCFGVHGAWVGWSHHHWLVDVAQDRIEFVFKSRALEGRKDLQVPHASYAALAEEDRVQTLWWDGPFAVRERVFVTADELDPYLAGVVPSAPRVNAEIPPARGALARLLRRVPRA